MDAGAWQPRLEELEQVRAAFGLARQAEPGPQPRLASRDAAAVRSSLKAESLQRTGSFKLRGALNKLRAHGGDGRAASSPAAPATTASRWPTRRGRGACPARSSCRVGAPVAKLDAVARFGAEVRQEGDSVDACVESARSAAAERDLLFVHPFDDLDVIAGQAGVGLELCEDVPDLGPGDRAGRRRRPGRAASARRSSGCGPEVELIGVQAASCPPFAARRWRAGQPVSCRRPP